jgi:hypothetical protein
VGFETYSTDGAMTSAFKGLPDDRCQCPHWGYVLKGKVGYRFADREETFVEGEAYYAAPGHVPVFYAGSQVVEFSPTEELAKTAEVVDRNLEKLARSAWGRSRRSASGEGSGPSSAVDWLSRRDIPWRGPGTVGTHRRLECGRPRHHRRAALAADPRTVRHCGTAGFAWLTATCIFAQRRRVGGVEDRQRLIALQVF